MLPLSLLFAVSWCWPSPPRWWRASFRRQRSARARPVQAPGDIFISEFHYDNAGADAGEFVEVTAPAGTDLTGWSIVLYNGTGGASS